MERKLHKKRKPQTKVGTWNTRQLGAYSTKFEPGMKTKCMFELMEKRTWHAALLTDVRYGADGIREYQTKRDTWTMVVRGKVAIAMSSSMAQEWKKGGCKVWVGTKMGKENQSRVMSVDIPPKGWKKGLHLVCQYSHTSTAPVAMRNKHWQELQKITNSAAPYRTLLLGGA